MMSLRNNLKQNVFDLSNKSQNYRQTGKHKFQVKLKNVLGQFMDLSFSGPVPPIVKTFQ